MASLALVVPQEVGDQVQGPNGQYAQQYQDVGESAGWYYTTIFDSSGNPVYSWGNLVVFTPWGNWVFPFEHFLVSNKKSENETVDNTETESLYYDGSTIKYEGNKVGPLKMMVYDPEVRTLSMQHLNESNGFQSMPLELRNARLIISVWNQQFQETKKIITK